MCNKGEKCETKEDAKVCRHLNFFFLWLEKFSAFFFFSPFFSSSFFFSFYWLKDSFLLKWQQALQPMCASKCSQLNLSLSFSLCYSSSTINILWSFALVIQSRTPYEDLIFVTSLTSQASGEKICHVEKFHLSLRDHCGEIWISPHVE